MSVVNGMHERKLNADVVVVGAGVIGLSIALEMHQRGAQVIVLERGEAMQQASTAAAGMLAADDPSNPTALLPLARLSLDLYPAFLTRVEALSGSSVPFQTKTAWQHEERRVMRLAEHSIDPRQLASAMVAAVRSTPTKLLEQTALVNVQDLVGGLRLSTSGGIEILTKSLVYATGAWSPDTTQIPIRPYKGQMLRVRTPQGFDEVHRSEQVYAVPRTIGPQTGSTLIGATVEDVGFDVAVHKEDLARLRGLAAALAPSLAMAPIVEAWAGLRPATPDRLPVLGAVEGSHRFIASGHFRNGVLLAPATATVLADLLTHKTPAIDLSAFSPKRFQT